MDDEPGVSGDPPQIGSSGPTPTEPSPPTEPTKPPKNTIGFGALIGLAILVGHVVSAIVPGGILLTVLAGVTQWVIVIPLTVVWFRSGRREAVKGLLLIAGLVSLANAVGCGYVLSSFATGL